MVDIVNENKGTNTMDLSSNSFNAILLKKTCVSEVDSIPLKILKKDIKIENN